MSQDEIVASEATVNLYALNAAGFWTGETATVPATAGFGSPWFYAPVAPPAAGPGQGVRWGSDAWEVVEGAAWQAQQANIPPPRRLIPKSVVQERANDIGKLDELMTALLANPLYFGRWFAPNHPNVYFDDPDLLAMLAAVGCTQAQIDVVTAP